MLIFYISFLVQFSFFYVFFAISHKFDPIDRFFKTLSMSCYYSLCFVVQNSLTYFSYICSPKLFSGYLVLMEHQRDTLGVSLCSEVNKDIFQYTSEQHSMDLPDITIQVDPVEAGWSTIIQYFSIQNKELKKSPIRLTLWKRVGVLKQYFSIQNKKS